MDLWIRSQDKRELVKANSIIVEQITDDEFSIEVNGYSRGAYRTRERALKILDEIQNYVSDKPIVKFSRMRDEHYMKTIRELTNGGFIGVENTMDITPARSMVYQMPKE